MAISHISDTDAASDFHGLLARVRVGEEIVIESGATAVAVLGQSRNRAAGWSH